MIDGFKCSRGSPIVTHLFFGDDNLLFSRDTVSNCESIKRLLDVYAKALVQLVNFSKSTLCVSPTVCTRICRELANIVGVCLVECHERCLRLASLTRRHR
ncbi:hypothetical protein Ddye_021714 [Dipteronia dyeriana]|uniref:Reverse transcriptase domain-containing protein n=1 Tax=Dipteronia dyeriana TaxID=168575 RepID=A0AAD9U371_9ROSI|nr:hypothetical protein Ddye_021714 [Dipteronia dyeriana]